MSTETGYRFTQAPWTPRVSVRVNSASGDRDPADPRLQSFNPLFPGASYAGLLGLFGPTNMTDLTPSVALAPHRNLTIGFERAVYWGTSTGDGLYTVDLRVLFDPSAGSGHHVGASYGLYVLWQATRHLQITGAFIRLVPGGFLETTLAGSGGRLSSLSITYHF